MKASDTRLVLIQRRITGTDEAGQPLDTWEDVGPLWADIGNDTGKAAIRRSGEVPVPYVRYSFMVRFQDVQALGVTADMRVVHDSQNFDIKGITRDFQRRDAAFIICELGASEG